MIQRSILPIKPASGRSAHLLSSHSMLTLQVHMTDLFAKLLYPGTGLMTLYCDVAEQRDRIMGIGHDLALLRIHL